MQYNPTTSSHRIASRQLSPALTQKPDVRIKAMWDCGPLRRWSTSKTTLTPMGYAKGGFVGAYVCWRCRTPCDGLYLVREGPGEELKWLCGPCKSRI
jgi:hypothetical protein